MHMCARDVSYGTEYVYRKCRECIHSFYHIMAFIPTLLREKRHKEPDKEAGLKQP